MPGATQNMKVSAAQARWFRIRRSGLIEPFTTPSETARHLIGVQAQLPAAADIAFFNRTADVSPAALEHERLEARDSWGSTCWGCGSAVTEATSWMRRDPRART